MPGFNHTTENMKTKTLLGFFLLSFMAFCVSACQDDAEIILFSGSELVDETGTCTNTVSSTVLYLNGWGSGEYRDSQWKRWLHCTKLR